MSQMGGQHTDIYYFKLENANMSTIRQIVQKLCKHSLLIGYNIYSRKEAVLGPTAKFPVK